MKPETDDLLRLLPPVRRVRGNRLYTADGARYLDLWLDGGRAILGERERQARVQAANAADKGLSRCYPGLYDRRFAKAVLATWPGFAAIRVFLNDERALAALGRLGAKPETPRVLQAPSSSARFILPRLPCPRPFAPAPVLARSEADFGSERGELVPQLMLAAGARALASWAGAEREGYGPGLWARFDKRLSAWFERDGPWLWARGRPRGAEYERFFRACMAGGALVSPDPDEPSAVPPDFDDGELVKLVRALASAARAD
ncbi:MAG: hypothetical protein KBB32_03115 [Spirochaetia bacterium]|nr:hypothetical protein [Spirochaetia bacterium]